MILNKTILSSRLSSSSVWASLKPTTEPENSSKCSNLIHKPKMLTSKTPCGIPNINLLYKNSKTKTLLYPSNIYNPK
jgi:hypothetical protein